MRVTEVFHSIQGESSFMGRPCVFVRLTGCPLRCTWCDTAYSFYGGTELSVGEILDRVGAYQCRLVEITGGEPLHQPESFGLISELCERDYTVLIETSGAVDITPVDCRARIVLDVKCPGSGMTDRMDWKNLDRLKPTDEVKFVIRHRADYDWARAIVQRYALADRCEVLFSPVYGEMEPRELSEWILADHVRVRFQLQLHKYIWHPDTRGV
jgi:7-carboxy-7-deazaguanine synthase